MYNLAQFCEKVFVSEYTLRKLEQEGKFSALRTLAGKRFYTDLHVRRFLGLNLDRYQVIVSFKSDGDFNEQINKLEVFLAAQGWDAEIWIDDESNKNSKNTKRKG